MDGEYRLRRMIGRLSHVADVVVRVEPSARDEVTVSDDVFGWRRDVYGPDAYGYGEWDDQRAAEAIAGVRDAVARSGGDSYRVTVIKIFCTETDTQIGDVRFAAAQAVARALGIPPVIGPN
ncbi:hypothetical protein Aab01nite_33650 [Paractinoplanes abujensis]|uniref:Uncharacterized protein n=1 Tax=Paractinoplanes abujensis TaxID=882441 RepID=A0A7W7D002_9ACTN|nr:hypothetical protein [Actinoplanes abujensis]MBB4697738.1 hypothetical protein [Actinoplanes abujensis]GID19775.1 hypothetical protein Aab01nite_33650 [Actinoplanes abujensis]